MSKAGGILNRMLFKFADPNQVDTIQRDYVRFFSEAGARHVLDIGSGRGIFLELLRTAGIKASGLDSDAATVAKCHEKGLTDVEVGDALELLEKKIASKSKYDGVFCSHIIEHLPGNKATRLIEASAELLAPRGRLVLVTPNVANLQVWTNVFWLDPTHQRPYPRLLLEALMKEAGLKIVASFDDQKTRYHYRRTPSDFRRFVSNFLRFGSGVLDGMDSVVVGERPV
ncbi:MAG: class I SAM-dependent methyltransferase [Pseudomonadota bacterium]